MSNKEEIDKLKEELDEKEQELEDYDDEDSYREMLNDCYTCDVVHFEPAEVLYQMDEIAYNCGLADYEDEGRSNLENEIQDLKDQIKDLEEEDE